MLIPKYNEIFKPLLEILADGQTHFLKDLKMKIGVFFRLSEDELAELLPSGRQTIFANRVGWAGTYLKKAGLIERPARATFVITSEGKKVLAENPTRVDIEYLMKFERFREFKKLSVSDVPAQMGDTDVDSTPDDTFEDSFRIINDSLADELLTEVMKISASGFEQIVVDLLSKMGYGAFENAGKTTTFTGDEGIDGIIMEDKLGFSLIYIQAKKWDIQNTVGRPEVQSFVGAISGKGGKGLFVTTAKFSKQAAEYAKRQHIILIDGEKLAKLMIEHNFGVRVKKIFEIKSIDTDLFNEYFE